MLLAALCARCWLLRLKACIYYLCIYCLRASAAWLLAQLAHDAALNFCARAHVLPLCSAHGYVLRVEAQPAMAAMAQPLS